MFELVTDSEPTFAGTGMRFLQIIITGSDFDRGREVSPAQYEALSASDRGAIEFYKKQADGSETVVAPEDLRVADLRTAGADPLFPARASSVGGIGGLELKATRF